MKKYYVVSGELSYVEPITDDGLGPTEYYRCYLEVEAKNRHEARKIAIKDKEFKDWVKDKRDNDECPLGGLEVGELVYCE